MVSIAAVITSAPAVAMIASPTAAPPAGADFAALYANSSKPRIFVIGSAPYCIES